MTRLVTAPARSKGPSVGLVLAIAVVTLIVVITLQLGGAIERCNLRVVDALGAMLEESLPKHLPSWLVWSGSVLLAIGLPTLLLAIHCAWQRWIVWTVTMGLLILWAPVLALASIQPELATPWLVTLCAGLLGLYFARTPGGRRR